MQEPSIHGNAGSRVQRLLPSGGGSSALRLRGAAAAALLIGLAAAACLGRAVPDPSGSVAAEPLRLLLPFPITGPRDVRGAERASRTYRAISPHAPQPVSDTLAGIVQSAMARSDDARVTIVRRPASENRLDRPDPARRAELLLLSHEAIVPQRSAATADLPLPSSTMPPQIEPVAPLAIMPLVLLVGPRLSTAGDAGAQDLRQIVARAARMGSAGGRTASRLAAAALLHATRASALHVPYNGGHAALNALATAEIDLLFGALPLVLPYLEGGRLQALGLAANERFALLPALTTLSEQGVALMWQGWFGVFGDAGIDTALRDEIERRLGTALAAPAVRRSLLSLGLQPAEWDRESFARQIALERVRLASLTASL